LRSVAHVLTLSDCPETKHEHAQSKAPVLVAILVGSYLFIITPQTYREEVRDTD
jgi:hypothetical protein